MSAIFNNITIKNHVKSSNIEDYTIFAGDLSESWSRWIQQQTYSAIIIITDENTSEKCLPVFIAKTGLTTFHHIEIVSGECNKTLSTCEKIWAEMIRFSADRKSLCINLGGGVIGDMGGFCAATYKRGIDFIQVPTTLLAQVDASIGGKLGIDIQNIKNGIGIFQNPAAVFIDTDFLLSLPIREYISGYAEMLKHALISQDNSWSLLNKKCPEINVQLIDIITDSIKIKKSFVDKDPFEENIRKALNFGHTIGHAIESYFLHQQKPILHGEAVAVGLVCEAYLSAVILNFPFEIVEEIVLVLSRVFTKVNLEENALEFLFALMNHDKKNEENQISFTLLSEVGNVKINQFPDKVLISNSIKYYIQKYPH